MSLQLVDSVTVTSAVASVFLTGINDDSVYVCIVTNASNLSGDYQLRMRVANSSTQDTAGNYDYAYTLLRSNNDEFQGAVQNAGFFAASTSGTSTVEVQNYIMYLYNWYDSAKYSNWSYEECSFDANSSVAGVQGAAVFDQTERHDSIRFYSGTSASTEADTTQGKFSLYKVVS